MNVTRTLAVMLFLCIAACSKQESKQEAPQQSKRTVMPGDVTTLSVPSGKEVPVASSEKALYRLHELAAAHDLTGIDQLMSAGVIWAVPSGTKCRVISRTGIFSCEVRLIDGAGGHADKTCFVTRDFIN